jgi:predicted kinase/uncharacterized glyoxalase superfamily protein PhnB
VLARYEHGAERRVSHADLVIGGSIFALTEEARAWNSDAPQSLGGSPVVLQLNVADTDAAVASMSDARATVVFPAQELLGERMARVRDPFGHIWILHQRLQELSTDAIQRLRDELFVQHATARDSPAPPSATARAESKTTLRDSHPLPQVRSDGPRGASIHLVLGPVGAGKSTLAGALARKHGALRLTLDEWMTRLFSEDRPEHGLMDWYVERTARCLEMIWSLAVDILERNTSVVLEIGLLSRRERDTFYERIDAAAAGLTIHVVDASRDVRRRRVEERNRIKGATFSMVVPPTIFELASELWEPPDAAECAGRDVRFIRTDERTND